jgi:hypothetical protein
MLKAKARLDIPAALSFSAATISIARECHEQNDKKKAEIDGC